MVNLEVAMSLGAFNVLVCDRSRSIADIRIQGRSGRPDSADPRLLADLCPASCPSGINSSVLIRGPQTHVSARLRDFSVLNADSSSVHKKVGSPPDAAAAAAAHPGAGGSGSGVREQL